MFINWVCSGSHIGYLPVTHRPRPKGKTGYSIIDKIRQAFQNSKRYAMFPLIYLVFIGIFLTVLALVLTAIGSLLGVKTITLHYGINNLIFVFLFGLILVSLGIIGNYVIEIFTNQLQKPAYFVSQILKKDRFTEQ